MYIGINKCRIWANYENFNFIFVNSRHLLLNLLQYFVDKNSSIMKTFFISLFLVGSLIMTGQGVIFNSSDATQGYTLFDNSSGIYLVDNCGKVINKWNVTDPTLHAKLLPDGNLIYIRGNSIIEMDWSGKIVKQVDVFDPVADITYEVIKMKKGNYLCVARKYITLAEMQSFGYNIPNTFPDLADMMVEIDPTGKVVWQWDIMDHVIQDVFPNKKAYGVIKNNPGKIDINSIATADWTYSESFMINSFDYNEELDQIAISIRKINEVAIIDHSTTTAQAKGSTGGRYGKGGDLLYRYGNPANYDQGTEAQHQLYFQHNPNWIHYGEHKGKMIIFNNLFAKENFSTVQIINPPINPDGSYTLEQNKPFQPLVPLVEYGRTIGKVMVSSPYTSGAKVLPNGNVFITEGRTGKLQEVKPDGKVVWSYQIPFPSGYTYRTEKYDANYEGFKNKTLTPGATIEFPPSNAACQIYTSTVETGVEVLPISVNITQGRCSTYLAENFIAQHR
jgi:Arylsulfotransferase (ASST)